MVEKNPLLGMTQVSVSGKAVGFTLSLTELQVEELLQPRQRLAQR
jgi:hypothetical protein